VAPPLEGASADQLVVAGGWQADLTLWHMAGGASRWDEGESRFVAEGNLPGVALAGSVAGYETGAACMTSGRAAVAALLGESVPAIDDPRIEALFETPDAATPVAPAAADAEPAYLDGGTSFITQPVPPAAGRRRRGRRQLRLTDELRALSLCDVAAAVQLGVIPAEQAAAIAQERCVTPGDLIDSGRRAPPLPAGRDEPPVPSYLLGRFGSTPVIRELKAADGRRFDIGCLIYRDADAADPRAAIGVILASGPAGVRALLQGAADLPETVSVRDISGPVAARLGAVVAEAAA
jgi:sarcosine oxidase subunit alpha